MRGVINVRGSVVPVVDLRLKLGMSRTEKTIDTCVVVLDVPGTGAQVTVGALVDSVQEVVDFDSGR
jgi:purine-binding chemotaxis protein CheW